MQVVNRLRACKNNFINLSVSISLNFKRLNVLNSGSICVICPLNDTMRKALFCNLAILSTLSD